MSPEEAERDNKFKLYSKDKQVIFLRDFLSRIKLTEGEFKNHPYISLLEKFSDQNILESEDNYIPRVLFMFSKSSPKVINPLLDQLLEENAKNS